MTNIISRSRGCNELEVCINVSLQNRGRRERRVLAAPAVSCAIVRRRNAHEHTGTDGAFRRSLRNGLTAYAARSPATNSSCHRRQRIGGSSKPGRASQTSASLTPATGARTTRFCRTQPSTPKASTGFRYPPAELGKGISAVRLRAVLAHGENPPCDHFHAPDAAASTATCPNVRDDGQRPSSRDRMARVLLLICPTG